VALHGHDIIGQAKTGTGKTLGFGIPVLQRVVATDEPGADLPIPIVRDKPQALVVVPTRELCVQVTEDLKKAAARRKIRVLSIYGGRAYEPQVEALKQGVEVVVGTPGRLIDLAQQGLLDLGHVRSLVLDEADEMLDLGFLPDVEKIVRLIPAGRQTMLFSATMPGAIITLARSYMHHPTHIRAVDPDDDGQTVKAVEQHVFRAHAMDKVEMLARILQSEGRGLTLVFCRTKRTAAKVADELADRGFASGAVHGDLGQGAREQALRAFRSGKVDVLVATDVAARGIDVQDITHVVNYQCPEDEKTYLHRIGRTARAGAKGIAITFVDWDDMPRWSLIDKALDLGFGEPEETYSTSEHFYEELEIPPGVTGVLPRAQRTRAGLAAEEIEDLGETGRAGRGGPAGRGGGPAGRGGSGGRSRPTERPTERAERAERAERPRRERTRTRTRSGQPADGATATAATAKATPAADATTEDPTRRRRRRSRGGRSSGGGPDAAGTGTGG
jgi:superfamily II DNA/RNA helicase